MIFGIDTDTSRYIALLGIRVIAGTLFFAQGYDKLFVLGIRNVYQPFEQLLSQKKIPTGLLKTGILISSVIEFIGGIMLMAGFMRDAALVLLLANMCFVAVAFSMVRPMWDMQHYFPRLALLLIVLLLPPAWDFWRIDSLLP